MGAGRAGLGLALSCERAGVPVRLHSRRAKPAPTGIPLTVGPLPPPPPWLPDVDVVLLAVPDAVIGSVAAALAQSGGVTAGHVVLHLSGVLDASALAALAPTGAGLGSLHPLLSFGDPATAPLRLRAAVAAVEGDERARLAALALARRLGLIAFELSAADKPRYHAGAVFAANFLVTIAATARRLLEQAGVPPVAASRGLATLMGGVLENILKEGPERALTGPVKRGDAETVRRNLAALDVETAALYRALSRATLEIAGLSAEQRRAVEEAIQDRADRRTGGPGDGSA
ncbi:MAG TPA: DUF2520 domain-containing protein [Gemmatimonadales bacterium]|nr:DUF2520 domain-containing protein [Gemmatimonadales bacterium]